MPVRREDFSIDPRKIYPLKGKLWLPDQDDQVLGLLHKSKTLKNWQIDLPRGISIRGTFRNVLLKASGYREPTDRDVELWNKHFKGPNGDVLSPQDVLNYVQVDLNQEAPGTTILCFVNVELTERNVRLLLIPYIHIDEDTLVPLGLMRRILTPQTELVEHHTAVRSKYDADVDDPQRAQIVKNCKKTPFVSALTRNCIRLYLALGYKSIELTAGFSAGSAVWPKYAFYPRTDKEWKELKTRIRDKHISLPKPIKMAAIARLRTITRNNDPQSIYWLSDITLTKLSLKPNLFDRKFAKYKVGGVLLQSQRWKGKLDLSNQRARKRLEKYLGTKNCTLP